MPPVDREDGYDVIGDVHGHADKLVSLLNAMGYEDVGGAWRHQRRQAVFVGDLIDRGPKQLETVRIARAMVDTGSAKIVAGNHEFNAVAFHTPHPETGERLRKDVPKNRTQHQAFLAAVEHQPPVHHEVIQWFMELPLWLDLDGLRVVHACWDDNMIESLAGLVSDTNSLTPELVVASSTKGSPEWDAVEHLLKGPEIPLDEPYFDYDRIPRHKARFRWWRHDPDRLADAVKIPGGVTTASHEPYQLPDVPFSSEISPYSGDIPVIFGHYWETGTPMIKTDRTACVDYSAAKAGPLVAYRWSGENVLTNDRFAVGPTPVN